MATNSKAAKRAPAGRRRPATPDPTDPLGFEEVEPVQIDPGPRPAPERFVLFRIGDEEFTAPKHIPPEVSLQALRLARRTPWANVLWFMVEQSVGEATIDRLVGSAAEPEQIAEIIARLRVRYLGQTEAMTGKTS